MTSIASQIAAQHTMSQCHLVPTRQKATHALTRMDSHTKFGIPSSVSSAGRATSNVSSAAGSSKAFFSSLCSASCKEWQHGYRKSLTTYVCWAPWLLQLPLLLGRVLPHPIPGSTDSTHVFLNRSHPFESQNQSPQSTSGSNPTASLSATAWKSARTSWQEQWPLSFKFLLERNAGSVLVDSPEPTWGDNTFEAKGAGTCSWIAFLRDFRACSTHACRCAKRDFDKAFSFQQKIKLRDTLTRKKRNTVSFLTARLI